MKKLLLIGAVAICAAFTGCGSKGTEEKPISAEQQQSIDQVRNMMQMQRQQMQQQQRPVGQQPTGQQPAPPQTAQ